MITIIGGKRKYCAMFCPSSICSEKLEAIAIDKKMRIIPIGKRIC
jgi:hypothetical protein